MVKRCFDWIWKYKYLIIISFIFLFIMTYCTLNTTLASDDYPYSLFYRGGARITKLSQVLANQLADYKSINGRIVTNGLGQILLMFDRPVFAILNSFVLLITILLGIHFVSYYKPITIKQRSMLLLLFIGLFLGLDFVKYLVYWIMGSANYIWTLPLLLLFLCYYARYGLFHKPILEAIYIVFVSSFHESLLVFFIIFLIVHIVYEKIKNKKLRKEYIYYIIALIFAGCFVFLSPGNQLRNSTWYPEWNKLNWFERLSMTIPIVGKTMFKFDLQHNIVPFIFLIVIFISLLMMKDRISKINMLLLGILYISAVITNDGWMYVIFSCILFLSETFIHVKNKNESLVLVSLSFYAIVYSMIITPEYAAGRPNYFMYFYMIIIISMMIIPLLKRKIIEIIIMIIFIVMSSYYVTREVMIYREMGIIIKDREIAIKKVKSGKEKVVYLKSIPKHLRMYHMEPNTPADKYYWAHGYFCVYYGIPKDTKIELVD